VAAAEDERSAIARTARREGLVAEGCARSQRLAWNVDYAALPDSADAIYHERTRDLVLELSSWPHPARWPVWDEWISARPRSDERARAISRLVSIGALDAIE
jgi:hypothetical protein